MNLRSFFVRPNLFIIFIAAVLCTAACARKNRRLYDFSTPQPPITLRVALPYVVRFSATYDKKLERYSLDWDALSPLEIPTGMQFIGYNIYRGTKLGFLPRFAYLQVSPQTHSCVVDGTLRVGGRQLFSIAPLFGDEFNREIIGLQSTVTIQR